MKKTFISLILFFQSCNQTITCEESAKLTRGDNYCILITSLKRFPEFIIGKDPKTLKIIEKIFLHDFWLFEVSDKLEVGDTLVKKKGELVIEIHKKDSTIFHPFICHGELYK
jgi:hypothetical protein